MNPDVPAGAPFHPKQTQQGAYSHRLSDGDAGGTHQRFRLGPDFFRQVVESLDDYAVFTTNVAGEVSSWNGAAERLMGYPEGEMIGRPAALLYTAQDQHSGIPGQQLHAARDNAQVLGEREHPRKDGSLFWAAGKVFPLLDEESVLRGFTLILRDVTPARAVRLALDDRERELQRLNAALAVVNAELASSNEELALSNEELATAGEEVAATNEELTSTNAVLAHLNGDLENFVYAASHDLKAPILNIEGLLQLLLKKLPGECLQPESVR
ncbi:MAG TPA: PAS domain-containing protein, partial [Cytophagales bacterium]